MVSDLLQRLQRQFQLVTFSHPGLMQLTVLIGDHHLSSCLLSTWSDNLCQVFVWSKKLVIIAMFCFYPVKLYRNNHRITYS